MYPSRGAAQAGWGMRVAAFEDRFRWGSGVVIGPVSRYPVEALRLCLDRQT